VDPDLPIIVYREAVGKADGGDTNRAARAKVYEHICNNLVPDYILSRYLHRVIPQRDQMWSFRKQLGAQMALSGYLAFVMAIGERSMHKVSFSRQSGMVFNSEFYINYNSQLVIEPHEAVPFRLTRNITTFFTPFVLEGIFVPVLTGTNSCLLRNQECLKNYLCLFIRDDILGWNPNWKAALSNDSMLRRMEQNTREKVSGNVTHILRRIHQLVPSQNEQPRVSVLFCHLYVSDAKDSDFVFLRIFSSAFTNPCAAQPEVHSAGEAGHSQIQALHDAADMGSVVLD
jgi:transformation/transcription domain-associated protein